MTDIRQITANSGYRKERLTDEYHAKIIERIEQEKGFVDWVTLSSNLLFSMNYASSLDELKKEKFYNKARISNYNADGYLHGVKVVRKDYRLLFEQYKDYPNVVFLVDPPYLSTDTTTYSREDYWKLSDYLNVLKTIEDTSYFYFTSNKSQIIELCDWMENNGYCKNPFADASIKTIGSQLTYNARYEDIMIYKNNE